MTAIVLVDWGHGHVVVSGWGVFVLICVIGFAVSIFKD